MPGRQTPLFDDPESPHRPERDAPPSTSVSDSR
jgi:hypothetical protein